jgi:uncharacterized membrane protein (DUF4010 family)
MENLSALQYLGLALAIGLLIGTERGWHARNEAEGARVAGIRTFGLAALSGGVIGLLTNQLGAMFAGVAFLGFAGLVIAGYWLDRGDSARSADRGMTTEVALLLSFILGLAATFGNPPDFALAAAISAVIATILLGIKPVLHAWLNRISAEELNATFKFLLISVVLLPLLPNHGYGPWQAFNPYLAWWMVVLVSALSFSGYIAIKFVGASRGVMLTSLLGGLVSSTATTLTLARYARAKHLNPALLAAGVLTASSIMFVRVLVTAGIINPALLPSLLSPLLVMTTITFGGAYWLWRQGTQIAHTDPAAQESSALSNPFELGSALKFGLLLSVILVLSIGAREWLGNTGLYLLALVSGLADVDAITLSTARMSLDGLAADIARNTILIAAFTNTGVKAMLALVIGGRELGLRVGGVILAATLITALSLSL